MICWHAWSKWKKTESGFLSTEYDSLTGRKLEEHEKFIYGRFFRQERECEKCGKLQVRRVDA